MCRILLLQQLRSCTMRLTAPQGITTRGRVKSGIFVVLIGTLGCIHHQRHDSADLDSCVDLVVVSIDEVPSNECSWISGSPPELVSFSLEPTQGLTGARGACAVVHGTTNGYTWLFALEPGRGNASVSCAINGCSFTVPKRDLREPVMRVRASAIDSHGKWANRFVHGALGSVTCKPWHAK